MKIMIRKNDNKQNKNDLSYANLDIFKPISIAVNIFYLFLLIKFADLN